jgi:hypothetical protein
VWIGNHRKCGGRGTKAADIFKSLSPVAKAWVAGTVSEAAVAEPQGKHIEGKHLYGEHIMSKSFYTGTEAELYTGSKNFSARISADPAAFGLTWVLVNPYAAANTTWMTLYEETRDPQNRTQIQIAAKNAARDTIRTMSANLAKIVEGTATVTDVQKLELGLNVRKTPAPIPAPTERPSVDLVSVAGRVVTVHIHDSASSTKRGKPAGATAALVYTFVGENYPSDLSAWRLDGAATKANYEITFGGEIPAGQPVWIRAAWINRKQEAGPLSTPITTNIQGGGSAVQMREMKIAA